MRHDSIRNGQQNPPGTWPYRPDDTSKSSVALHQSGAGQHFRVTHPFHPRFQHEFKAVTVRHNWAEERVYYHDERGHLVSIPTGWTSLAAEDPFVLAAQGRAFFRMEDLLRLIAMVEALQAELRR